MNSEEQDQAISAAAEAVAGADTLIITAGAGMGVDSGLPDFRGTQGFWKAYPHAKKLGLSFADLANPQWFTEDPEEMVGTKTIQTVCFHIECGRPL